MNSPTLAPSALPLSVTALRLRTLSLLDGAYRSAATGELVRFQDGVL